MFPNQLDNSSLFFKINCNKGVADVMSHELRRWFRNFRFGGKVKFRTNCRVVDLKGRRFFLPYPHNSQAPLKLSIVVENTLNKIYLLFPMRIKYPIMNYGSYVAVYVSR